MARGAGAGRRARGGACGAAGGRHRSRRGGGRPPSRDEAGRRARPLSEGRDPLRAGTHERGVRRVLRPHPGSPRACRAVQQHRGDLCVAWRVRPGARRPRERDPREPRLCRRVREPRRRLCPARRARLREVARPRRRQPDRAGEARARARAPGRDAEASGRGPAGEAVGRRRARLCLSQLQQRSPTLAQTPARRRLPRLRVPGARRRSAGRAQDEPRGDRPRAVPRQGAQDRRQLPPIREGRALQRHGLPPRHRRLHDPGRRLRARTCARSRRAAPVPNEAGNGLKNDSRHDRDGAHFRPALGERPVLHQREGQRLPELPRAHAATATATRCSARSSRAWTSSTGSPSRRPATPASTRTFPREPIVIESASVLPAK